MSTNFFEHFFASPTTSPSDFGKWLSKTADEIMQSALHALGIEATKENLASARMAMWQRQRDSAAWVTEKLLSGNSTEGTWAMQYTAMAMATAGVEAVCNPRL
jgi:hypothetical protein